MEEPDEDWLQQKGHPGGLDSGRETEDLTAHRRPGLREKQGQNGRNEIPSQPYRIFGPSVQRSRLTHNTNPCWFNTFMGVLDSSVQNYRISIANAWRYDSFARSPRCHVRFRAPFPCWFNTFINTIQATHLLATLKAFIGMFCVNIF